MLPDSCVHQNFPIVVTAYTIDSHLGNYYKKTVKRLIKSLHRFDLPYIVYPLNKSKNWIRGCNLKAKVIVHTLKRMQHPILWIDADGEVFKFPSIFINPNFSLGLSDVGGHWLTGTMYVDISCVDFIKRWEKRLRKDPDEPDEVAMLHHYRNYKNPPKLQLLGSEYNSIIHQNTNTSKLIIGHYIRPDIANERKVKPVPTPSWGN